VIRFTLRDEPPRFDERCRKRGRKWLKDNPGYDGRPRDYWSEFEPELREAFQRLCAYCAMRVFKGNVDHFTSVSVLKKRKEDHRAYEWDNFRYGEAVLNQRKGNCIVLDPFEVREDWFRLLLPSMQLVLTDRVPRRMRKRAELTLRRLGLDHSEVVVRYRQEWFEMFRERKLTLEGLREVAPQIARAVEKSGVDWRYPPGKSFARRGRGAH
jgi:hypothetical protein